MPGRDQRTVGDLLADTDALARETLVDLSPDAAPAMLRTFAQVVQSAARLSSVLPPATMALTHEPDVMMRLQAVGRGIGRSVSMSRWPGPGPTDDRLAEMSQNLNRAAVLVERHGRDVQPTTPEARADIAAARDRVVHAVYVAAHGTAVTLTRHTSDLQRRSDPGTRRHQRASEQPKPMDVPAIHSYLSRLDVFEQLAGAYVARHPVALAALGEARTAPPGTRLELAIARWDIQAHRTLAAHPTPPDLVRVARTQALIATTTLIVTSAAADQGKVDTGAVQRLSPTLEAAQIAWTLTANLWSNVKSPTGRTDPNLIRAASDIRTAIAATAHTPTGWASPERLAEQVDLAKTVKVLQLGMVASVDVAHVMREVAAVGLAATAPQQPMTLAARGAPGQATTITGLPNDSSIAASGADGSSSKLAAMAADHRRRGLVSQADAVIATTSDAVSVTASVVPTEMKASRQSGFTKRPTELRAEKRVVPDRPFPTDPRR